MGNRASVRHKNSHHPIPTPSLGPYCVECKRRIGHQSLSLPRLRKEGNSFSRIPKKGRDAISYSVSLQYNSHADVAIIDLGKNTEFSSPPLVKRRGGSHNAGKVVPIISFKLRCEFAGVYTDSEGL